MKKIICFFLLFVCFYESNASSLFGAKVIKIPFLGQCKGKDDLPVFLETANVVQKKKHSYYLNGGIVVRENFPHGFKTFLEVKKCQQAGNLESCRIFLNKMANPEMCGILNDTEAIYHYFLAQVQPPPLCPFNIGTHKIVDIPIDNDLIKYLPVGSVQIYDVTISGFQKSREVLCFRFIVEIRPVRS